MVANPVHSVNSQLNRENIRYTINIRYTSTTVLYYISIRFMVFSKLKTPEPSQMGLFALYGDSNINSNSNY